MNEKKIEAPLLEVKHLKKMFPVKSGILSREKSSIKAVDDVSFSLMPTSIPNLSLTDCAKARNNVSKLSLVR